VRRAICASQPGHRYFARHAAVRAALAVYDRLCVLKVHRDAGVAAESEPRSAVTLDDADERVDAVARLYSTRNILTNDLANDGSRLRAAQNVARGCPDRPAKSDRREYGTYCSPESKDHQGRPDRSYDCGASSTCDWQQGRH
jgi:hypothetical protein